MSDVPTDAEVRRAIVTLLSDGYEHQLKTAAAVGQAGPIAKDDAGSEVKIALLLDDACDAWAIAGKRLSEARDLASRRASAAMKAKQPAPIRKGTECLGGFTADMDRNFRAEQVAAEARDEKVVAWRMRPRQYEIVSNGTGGDAA